MDCENLSAGDSGVDLSLSHLLLLSYPLLCLYLPSLTLPFSLVHHPTNNNNDIIIIINNNTSSSIKLSRTSCSFLDAPAHRTAVPMLLDLETGRAMR